MDTLDIDRFIAWTKGDQEKYTKETFVSHALEPPCRICGSGTHGMLTRTAEWGDEMTGSYNCPAAKHDEWDNNSLWPSSRKYEICQYKLATSLGYDEAKIPQALYEYRTKGEGRMLSEGQLQVMEECLRYICQKNTSTEPWVQGEDIDMKESRPKEG